MVVDCLIFPIVFIYFCLQIFSFDCSSITSIKKIVGRLCRSAEKLSEIEKIVNRNIFITKK